MRLEVLSVRNEAAGVRLATLKASGSGCERLLGESGVHSIQHITRSRKKDRIHTSTVTVVALSVAEIELTDAEHSFDLERDEIRIDTFRGSGAGGQHRNKTDSAVRATHIPSGEVVTITSGRSQHKNKEAARLLLAMKLKEKVSASQAETSRDQRRAHTSGERARALRTYDLVRDVVRCSNGSKVRGAAKVLAGDLDRII